MNINTTMEVTLGENTTLLIDRREMTSNIFVLTALQLVLLIGIFLIGLVGNLLVIVVVSLSRSLHNVTSIFVVLLAASDISVCVSVIPMFAAALVAGRTWPMHAGTCTAAGVMYVTFRWTSILALMLISVERCIGIRMPLHYPKLLTPRIAGGLISMAVLYALLIALLPIFGLGRYTFSITKGTCAPDYAYSPVHAVITLVGSSCLPLFITLIIYAAIAQVALQTAKRGVIVCDENNCTYVPSKKGEIKAVKTLCIITGVFIICWLPYIIINLHYVQVQQHPNIYADAITESLSLLSSALNPLMYSLLNRAFRLALKKLKIKVCTTVSANRNLQAPKLAAQRKLEKENAEPKDITPCEQKELEQLHNGQLNINDTTANHNQNQDPAELKNAGSITSLA